MLDKDELDGGLLDKGELDDSLLDISEFNFITSYCSTCITSFVCTEYVFCRIYSFFFKELHVKVVWFSLLL